MLRFSNNRNRRRIIFAMLFVWSFALGSAWANACALQARGTHWDAPTDRAGQGAQAARLSPGHLGVDAAHPENEGSAKGACLKACADDTQTIVKSASSADSGASAMLPSISQPWSSAQGTGMGIEAWLELPAPDPGVPLRTRFSRLAL